MAPKKRPASAAGEASEAGRVSRVGFKDHKMLASALAPHVTKRLSLTYNVSREMKCIDKKKLQSRPP